jgi:hypothetical protein
MITSHGKRQLSKGQGDAFFAFALLVTELQKVFPIWRLATACGADRLFQGKALTANRQNKKARKLPCLLAERKKGRKHFLQFCYQPRERKKHVALALG